MRWLKFRDKHTKQNKIIDMSLLPPCKENLKPKTYSQTIWMIYFSILYLMKMITNLTANVLSQKTHKFQGILASENFKKQTNCHDVLTVSLKMLQSAHFLEFCNQKCQDLGKFLRWYQPISGYYFHYIETRPLVSTRKVCKKYLSKSAYLGRFSPARLLKLHSTTFSFLWKWTG